MKRIRNLKEKLMLLFLYAAIILTAFFLGLPCVWQFLFGIPCPGCGMTRAVFSLLRFDIRGAAFLHPMVFFLPLLFLYYLYDGRLFANRKIDRLLLWTIAFGFLAQWVWKL